MKFEKSVAALAACCLLSSTLGTSKPALEAGLYRIDSDPFAGQAQPAQPNPLQQPTRTALSPEERADIFMARKSYADAVDYYYRALKQAGLSEPRLWNKLGIAYQQQSNNRAARKAYNQAIRRQRNFPEAWNNVATVYYGENRFKKSVKYYRRAIELDPNSASFHLNLGSSYYRMKKFKEAVEEYRTALALDPDILTTHASVGTVMQTRGADAEFYFYLAKVFASLGRPDEAVHYLHRAFEDGFRDTARLEQDPDFQKINQHPGYVQLVKNPPVPIKD